MSGYDGQVTPGGPAQVRELERLTIHKLAVDEATSNNCYLLTCRATGERLMIDAAADAPRVLGMLADAAAEGVGAAERLVAVVTTHQHWDHHRALADVVAATDAPVLVGAPDADAVTEQTGVEVARRLEHDDEITVGEATLRVIRLTGHTPGSVCLRYDDPAGHSHLFTGDSLFPGGVGNTFGDDAAFATLIEDVQRRVFDVLDDDTWFYPGHGNDSTVGAERPSIPEWLARRW